MAKELPSTCGRCGVRLKSPVYFWTHPKKGRLRICQRCRDELLLEMRDKPTGGWNNPPGLDA
ncbi:MAG: hypothetical protein EOM93_06330 [Gammaproteobacteria bacterium]|nr:hypothetical protein [Gammaproteobacteria bacterium]